MILLVAVVAGLAAGLVRAAWGKRRFVPPPLHGIWLALLAFSLQYLALSFGPLRGLVNQQMAAFTLVSSLLLLLIFAWQNRHSVAFYWLGAGLFLNLAVIVLNGGLMPISPQTLARVFSDVSASTVEIGSRVGISKNVALLAADTRLEWLADRFLLPDRLPIQAAFSAGDVLIAIGAFWLLWQSGAANRAPTTDAVASTSSAGTTVEPLAAPDNERKVAG